MPKITGATFVGKKLNRLAGSEKLALVGQALYVGGGMIQAEAKVMLTTGAVSGKSHKPSAPGTPPNNDTGHLASLIEVTQPAPLKVHITSNAEYSAIHEYGGTINHPGGTPYFIDQNTGLAVFVRKDSGSRILGANLPVTKPHTITLPARPFMGPAARKRRKDVTTLVTKAINAAIRKG